MCFQTLLGDVRHELSTQRTGCCKTKSCVQDFVVCGIQVVSRPTAFEFEFHFVLALCLASALCQNGEVVFVYKTGLLWPLQTVCR